MELIAAIDLLEGRARRLVQGDYARPVAHSAEAASLARRWVAAGVRRLHVVDLDGARLGRPAQASLLTEVCSAAARVVAGIRIQAGGGLRDTASIATVLEAGADEAILGSAAVTDPAFLAACAQRWPGRIGASLDLLDGRPAVNGWTASADRDPMALAAQLVDAGASQLVVTDVSRDGTGSGPNLELLTAYRRRFASARLVSAGGVRRPADLSALRDAGIDGAIVGLALLDGSLDVADALQACVAAVGA